MSRLDEHLSRLITARYWVAIALTALIVTGTYFVLISAIQMERGGFKILAMSAAQRVNSQRICFLSHALVDATDEQELLYYRGALRRAVREMSNLHSVLSLRSDAENMPSGMRTILHDTYRAQSQPFATEVDEFLKNARTVLTTADNDLHDTMPELERLSEAGSRSIMRTQKLLFKLLREEEQRVFERLLWLGAALWLLTLVVLILEVQFIFRPMSRRASRAVKRLEAARERAERNATTARQAREGQASFIRTMSHELRTPLNAILGMTDMMKTGIAPEKQNEYAHDIHEAGQHLLDLINDILEFSRLEAGQVIIEPAPVSLRAEVQWTLSLVRPLAEKKGLDLECRCDPGLARSYLADGPRIRQILVNLVGNALKFTERGTISVRVTYEGSAGETSDLVRFEVRDTGIGVPQEMQSRIFEEFQQADSSMTRRHDGSGLGLAISNRLVRLMNGEIGVESIEGDGSLFWFTLPLQWTVSSHGETRETGTAGQSR